ncbi:hypothetical protein TMatcc_011232 [Talaromyces marneffei ATCC 18224]
MAMSRSKAIKKLEDATEGAIVTTSELHGKNEDDLQEKCEICAMNDNKRQVSRVPIPKPNRAFHTLFVDIIVMTQAITREQYALHAVYPFAKFHALATVDSKAVVADMKAIIEKIEHTFRTHVEVVHTDGESSLNGLAFRTWCNGRHTLLYMTVPNTPEQNGPSERAGGLITKRARHKIQEANIPFVLWPYAMKASIHTINRTPTKALNWKTPYEIAYGKKPYVGNLFVFGAKAYVRIENKKSQKMAARAQIGYLVGYEAHNIWQIWVDHPKGFRVIRARDVIFDETKSSVDENMHLQPFVSRFSPISGGNTQNMDQPMAEKPESIEIEQQPPKYSQEMEIDAEEQEYEAQKEQESAVYKDILVDQEDIESTGGVEVNIEEEEEAEPGDEHEDKDIEEGDIPIRSGSTDILQRQLPRISTPTNQKAPFDPDDVKNGLPTPPEELSPLTNVLRRQEGQSNVLGSSEQGNQPITSNSAPKAQDISADLSQENILTTPRVRIASKRAHSPESLPSTTKRQRKEARALFARQKLLQDSTLAYTFLAAQEKRHPFVKQFTHAATDEFTKLKQKGTFEFVPRPRNIQILPLTWVFKYKFDKHGKLAKFKARICVRGDLQDANKLPTRAATLASRNFRMMMSLAAVFDLEIVQFDAVNAFVNSELDEDVYTYFPDGFREAGKVMKLKRALYGLRRSPRLWQLELTRTLLGLGFSQIPDEECLFVKNGVILLFFVDDILVFYDKGQKQAEFEEIEKGLNDAYELRKMDKFEWFLNIRITRDRAQRKIWLCQDSYIIKIAERFKCNTTKPILTPISAKIEASTGEATNTEIHAYQELVGSALYAAIMTRPDVAKATPLYAHQMLHSATMTTAQAPRRLVTTSTTEAELRAITEAAKRLHVWKRVFKSIGYTPDRELCIQCDNKQTILLLTAEDPQFRTNLKHVDIYHHWLRQEIRCNRLRVEWVGTKEMIADGFTKILHGQAYLDWRQHQGLVDITTLIHE